MDFVNIKLLKFNSSHGAYMKWNNIDSIERLHDIVDYLGRVEYEPLEKIFNEIEFVGGRRKQHNEIINVLREDYKEKLQEENQLMERAKVDFGYNFDNRDKDVIINDFPETMYKTLSPDLRSNYTQHEYGVMMNLLRYFIEENKVCNE